MTETKQACVKFAQEHLLIQDAAEARMAACHRLNQQSDAAIYVAFVDLEDRNKWLSSARNLKQQDGKVSLTLDLPPVIRPLKNELKIGRAHV